MITTFKTKSKINVSDNDRELWQGQKTNNILDDEKNSDKRNQQR